MIFESRSFKYKLIFTNINLPQTILKDCNDRGQHCTPITLILEEKYYNLYEYILLCDRSKIKVVNIKFIKLGYWEYTCMFDHSDQILNLNTVKAGSVTRGAYNYNLT